MLKINNQIKPVDLKPKLKKFWRLSGEKIRLIEDHYDPDKGSPVFTVNGRYTNRGWTDWTQGFQIGSAILQFDATGQNEFLEIGRQNTLKKMAPHLTHTGVHDHGFNNVSTYGNLLRLMIEGKIPLNEWERNFYELALKVSGCVQASRWTDLENGGYIYSFNGPHSLFVDTIRSCRILMLSYKLGQSLLVENDWEISLLHRAVQHLMTTAKYAVYYGEGRDAYDVRGRTAHESIFDIKDGNYRCPNSQQGYSPFTTWTRGLSWAMLGFSEELEFIDTLDDVELAEAGEKESVMAILLNGAQATADFYIEHTPLDGIPYWDTGAPGLSQMGDYLDREADPYNEFEPVDSSAAVIAAQGLLRLGAYLRKSGDAEGGDYYLRAGLTVMKSLLEERYLRADVSHQGLLLHAIYHRPNGWDHIPEGSRVPNGESCMWGDYHARELALYLNRIINDETYYTFYSGLS
jgi:unsaturated chondroitin disaccharide hydrolase